MLHRKQLVKMGILSGAVFGWIAWLGFFSGSAAETYEIRPEITLGPYQTETMRMMDSYKRLSDQYLSLVQSNLSSMAIDTRQLVEKLDSMDCKLDTLTRQITRIEKHLGLPAVNSSNPIKPTSAEPARDLPRRRSEAQRQPSQTPQGRP
ncbi:MAG: hypothetical protein JXA82_15700 [Sedimentisphaerales bacterium]|nr:hypothetical protein [Sedimentisphaerales bacterium]